MLESSAEDGILPVRALAQNGQVRISVARIGHLTHCRQIIVECGIFPQIHHIQPFVLLGYCEHSVI